MQFELVWIGYGILFADLLMSLPMRSSIFCWSWVMKLFSVSTCSPFCYLPVLSENFELHYWRTSAFPVFLLILPTALFLSSSSFLSALFFTLISFCHVVLQLLLLSVRYFSAYFSCWKWKLSSLILLCRLRFSNICNLKISLCVKQTYFQIK